MSALPNFRHAIKAVPYSLRAAADFLRGHCGMGGIELGAEHSWNEPVTGYGNTLNPFHGLSLTLFPAFKIDGAGERRHHHELSEGDFSLLGKRGGGFESVRAVRGQAED